MSLLREIRSELYKMRHTAFLPIHLVIPFVGALLFIFYFINYEGVTEHERLRLLLELTTMVFPLLISGVIGINISLEEKACYYQRLLIAPNRKICILAKLTVLYCFGIMALTILFGVFALGISVLGSLETLSWGIMLQAVLGIAFGNFVIYTLHLFLNLKFGLAMSLFWGVFESLQVVLYSNIELQGVMRYIPFSWAINSIQDALNGNLLENITEWILIFILTVCVSLIIIKWFSHWEGRKNYE